MISYFGQIKQHNLEYLSVYRYKTEIYRITKNVGTCPNFGLCCHGNANNRKSSRKNISYFKPLGKKYQGKKHFDLS